MELWGLEEIQDATFEEVLEYLQELEEIRKPLHLVFQEVDPRLFHQTEISMQQLSSYMDVDGEKGVCTYPSGEEEEKLLFLGRKQLPVKGFRWRLYTDKKESPFALIKILFEAQMVGRKENDRRHPDFRHAERDTKHFYYDYEKETYVQVNLRNKGENVEKAEYFRRQELLAAITEKFNEVYDRYLESLQDIALYVKWPRLETAQHYINFFQKVDKWLQTHLVYLQLERFYDRTDVENIAHLHEYTEELQKKMSDMCEELKVWKENKGDETLVYGDTELKIRLGALEKEVRRLFSYRDYDSDIFKSEEHGDGYYDWDEHRLYPNFCEIAYVSAYTTKAESGHSKQQEEQKLLQHLLRQRK